MMLAKQWFTAKCELRSSRNAEWIRIVAANLVLLHHMQPWAPDLFRSKLMQTFSEYGAVYSVSCFWVYSGFVFDSVYNLRVSTGTVSRLSFLSFLIRRIRRLYPLHITILVLILVYSWCRPSQSDFYIGTWPRLLANILLVQNFLGGTSEFSINPVTWSVSVELVSYVLFFCWLRYSRNFVTAAIPFFVMILFVRVTGVSNSPVTSTGMFFAGVLISHCVKAISKNQHLVVALTIATLLFSFGTISTTFFSLRIIGLVAFGIICCMKLTPSRLVQFFADRTYTIYMTHVLLIPLAEFVTAETHISDLVAVVVWWMICWVVSMVIDLVIFKPLSSNKTVRRLVSKVECIAISRPKHIMD
jgi:peptidoglycan/LPS O-acetylase OafA/YrhL